MIGEQKTTDEAKITQEHGFFAQPTKIVIDASKGDDMINIHTNQERFVFFVSNAPILDTKTLQAALIGGYKLFAAVLGG